MAQTRSGGSSTANQRRPIDRYPSRAPLRPAIARASRARRPSGGASPRSLAFGPSPNTRGRLPTRRARINCSLKLPQLPTAFERNKVTLLRHRLPKRCLLHSTVPRRSGRKIDIRGGAPRGYRPGLLVSRGRWSPAQATHHSRANQKRSAQEIGWNLCSLWRARDHDRPYC